jgi:hypothetical protein
MVVSTFYEYDIYQVPAVVRIPGGAVSPPLDGNHFHFKHSLRIMWLRHRERDNTDRNTSVNLLKPSGHYTSMYHLISHSKTLHSAHTVFRMVLTVNSDCFPKQH